MVDKTLLVAVDLGGGAELVVKQAAKFAGALGYRAILMAVVEPEPNLGLVAPVGGRVLVDPKAQDEALRFLAALRGVFQDAKVPVEQVVRQGPVVREILAQAQEPGVQLLVMGTHGRSGVRRLVMGSVAESVLRDAPCPVLVVKTDPGTVEALLKVQGLAGEAKPA